MRTSLKYSVEKRERYDAVKDKMVSFIKSRGFEFSVSGAKTEEEHIDIVDNFKSYIEQFGYSSDGFGTGTWEENVRLKNTKEFLFLYIPVDSLEDKEQIENIYKEWKVKR